MYALCRRSTSVQLCSRLYTSAVRHKGSKPRRKGSSRTKLAQDLTPSSPTGKYEKAQEEPRFERDSAPHQDQAVLKRYTKTWSSRGDRRDNSIRSEKDFWSVPPRPRPPPSNLSAQFPLSRPTERVKVKPFLSLSGEPPESEFYNPPSPVSLSSLSEEKGGSILSEKTFQTPRDFSSPPLLPAFLPALSEMLGPGARPTPIQGLSIKWLIEESGVDLSKSEWKQFLLASETGSGKSLAYLLPLVQKLKLDEQSGAYIPNPDSKYALNPRAIILAPTHELSRQLSSFAKVLAREVKLRVLCASRANSPSTTKSDLTAKQLSERLDAVVGGADDLGEIEVQKDKFPVDILIGTPVKVMELIRGRGWDRLEGELQLGEDGQPPKLRRGRDKMPGIGSWRTQSNLGLQNVEWVVVDEADVLFDPDFQEITRTLLSDISSARGKPVQVNPIESSLSSFTPVNQPSTPPEPIHYPFNFILTSATIPKNLATYLDHHHPALVRLASPRLHHLPKNLKPEYVSWSGGNKFADIQHQIRKIWASDAVAWSIVESGTLHKLSKILIFCNRSSKVDELAAYLEQQGIKCVALTSTSDQRKRGSNKHLEGFLRPVQINPDPERERGSSILESNKKKKTKSNDDVVDKAQAQAAAVLHDPKITPHVMVTTSLLSRGLDFSADVGHVFIVDEPRNMIDFLHRAGRSGRAGQRGKVVVFGKMKGRGSMRSREVLESLKYFVKK